MPPFAHSLAGEPQHLWEPLSHHLTQVGHLARRFAAAFGAGELALAAGLLHDIGKVSIAFQAYINGADAGRGPDHSTAGAVEATRRYGASAPLAARLIAFAIAGHHAGLADGTGHRGGSLQARLEKRDLPDYAGWETQVSDLPELPQVDWQQRADYRAPAGYAEVFLGRMLFSCLVDADFLATEAFYANASGVPIERGDATPLTELRERLDRHLDKLVAGAKSSPLNSLRAEILVHARGKAAVAPGLFTMTVPTGGGKTLASLAFALDHAIAHGLDRVIYVIPYTSIIEQTAAIFKTVLGDAHVLEHHGNVEWEKSRQGDGDEGRDGLDKLRRASENWDVRIVVTTAVQFFESLHASRTGRCRKLHNLARSVIILDEAQTLPVPLLRPCIAAIDELAGHYGASVVLCTATQPAMRAQDGFKGGLHIPDDRELAPDPKGLYEALKRVTVEVLPEAVDDATIAARFAETPQMLCIVNSRRHAQDLFAAIKDLPGARHLTTLMCPAHRRAVLAELRDALKVGHPVRLVATSLIEAGVDIDFPEVWRAETGLDSVAQAAGRCNREDNRNTGRVVVFASSDHASPRQFAQQIAAMHETLRHHGDDPLGLDAVRTYFRTLYWSKGEAQLDASRTLDDKAFPILKEIAQRRIKYDFPYASITEAFRMIDDVMDPVIIPWRGGADPEEPQRLISALRGALRNKGRLPGGVLRRLQHYTVSVPTKVRAKMLATGSVQVVDKDHGDRFVVLVGGRYDAATGLALDEYAADPKDLMFGPF
ncbi:CRISPR-associated endonuclease Cas3'' [Sphingomonas qilianensis]|uniref:CRISPR-associated endonuclease Cas3 n=1 Tax=Sphingomonas qilianensis TaxID=1736690 RepID=A0ABU9XTJ6_9SPHN